MAFVRDQIDVVLFDCDGVVYRSPAPGARSCIESLLSQGKQVYFVTNNSSVSRKQLKEKLESILAMDDTSRNSEDGDDDKSLCLSEEMMVGSGYTTAQFLRQTILDKKKKSDEKGRVFVVGGSGLCHELETNWI